MSLHFKDTPHFSGLPFVTVTNSCIMPQDKFPFRKMAGVDVDGKTVKVFDLETEFHDQYFIIFFFPMDFTIDSQEVTSFSKFLSEFAAENCQVFVPASRSPPRLFRWWVSPRTAPWPSPGG